MAKEILLEFVSEGDVRERKVVVLRRVCVVGIESRDS